MCSFKNQTNITYFNGLFFKFICKDNLYMNISIESKQKNQLIFCYFMLIIKIYFSKATLLF